MKKKFTAAALSIAILCCCSVTNVWATDVEGSASSFINDHVTFSGAIEVEASWSEDFEGATESSIDLATAEFGFEAEIAEWALGMMAIEWDGDEENFNVDEAFITLGGTGDFPGYVQAGRYVIPFGVYDGNTISDPLTTEVFETKEDAIMVGAAFGPVSLDAFAYNGETNEGGGDAGIEQFGAAIGFAMETDAVQFEAHIGYANSIVDSDGLQEEWDPEADYVGGIALQAGVRVAGFVFIGEYITAVDDYESDDGIVNAQPSAYQLEAGYNFNIGSLASLVSLGYSGTADLGGIYPETRLLVDFGIEIIEGLGVNLEYAHDIDYGLEDGGTDQESDAVIAQLYFEF